MTLCFNMVYSFVSKIFMMMSIIISRNMSKRWDRRSSGILSRVDW